MEAPGHSYEIIVAEPTCVNQGYTTYTCHCGYSFTEDYVAAYGHSHEAVVTAPTCTEQGYTTYTCHCGDSYIADYVEATGHNYENNVCTDCGAKENAGNQNSWQNWFEKFFGHWWGSQDKCDHQYVSAVTAPTCTERGYTTYTCTECGNSYKDSYVSALGHDWDDGEVVKNATCTEKGEKIRVCKTCGEELHEAIEQLDHKFENGVCVECGKAENSKPSKPGWGFIWDYIFPWW